MLSIVDTEEQMAKLLPHLDKMVDEGLIVMSNVEVIRYVRQEAVRPQGQ
jgi:PII-like signaling protein